MSATSDWQSWRCGVVLREVFAWLGGRDLAQAGASCRAWYRAAAEPLLWRRLLLSERRTEPSVLKYLCNHSTDTDTVSWRQEYVTTCAGWVLEARHKPAGGATLLHAALAPTNDVLALGADDASLAVWRRVAGSWREVWRTELRERGWAGVARVQWARRSPSLLLAGPRALIDDWELMVVHLDEDYSGGTIASRVRCGAGAAGCWAGPEGGAFLSLELQLLAPRLACTTVRLNAATQETQSEYAGVTVPLLRIFNEDRAHITHVIVALAGCRRVLVAGTSARLASWPVVAPRPPPLLVGAPGELAERVRRHRARRAAPEEEPPEPDEESVRALCAPPDYEWRLPSPLVGLVCDDSEGCVWAACSDGSVSRVCVRSLSPQLRVCVRAALRRAPAHYVQPAVSAEYVASPEGGYSPRVWVWSLRTGAVAQCGGGSERGTRHKYENTDERDGHIQHNGGSVQREHDANEHRNENEHDGNINDGCNDLRPGSSSMSDSEQVSNQNNENLEANGEQESDTEHDVSDENHRSNKSIRDGETNIGEFADVGESNAVRDDSNSNNEIAEHHSNVVHDGLARDEIGHGSSSANDSGDNDGTLGAGEIGSGPVGNSVSAVDCGSGSERVFDGVSSEGEERNSGNGSINGSNGGSESGSDCGHKVLDGGVSERQERNSGSGSTDEVDGSSGSGHRRGSGRGHSGAVQHGGAAVCALLPSDDPAAMLVLAADELYVWRRRMIPQSSSSLFYD